MRVLFWRGLVFLGVEDILEMMVFLYIYRKMTLQGDI